MLSSVNIFAHFSDLSWYAGLLPITHIYYTFPNEGFSLLQYNCLKVSSCNVRWVFLVFLFLLKATTFLWCVLIPPHLPFFLFLILKEQVCYDLLLDHWFLLVCCCCCFGAFFFTDIKEKWRNGYHNYGKRHWSIIDIAALYVLENMKSHKVRKKTRQFCMRLFDFPVLLTVRASKWFYSSVCQLFFI